MKHHLLISFIFVIFISCQTNNSENSSKKHEAELPLQPIAKDVTAEVFKDLLETNIGTLIDVRTPEEFKNGSIGNAQNIDFLDSQFVNNIDLLDRSKPVYVFCQAGGRSGRAMKTLKENGFTEVYNLIGGYGQWPF
ncbi:MAG: rhodanese-like domain-containing protein [Crocinitomicaceae bacterium]